MVRRGLLILLVVKLALGGLLILPKSAYAQLAGFRETLPWYFEDTTRKRVVNQTFRGDIKAVYKFLAVGQLEELQDTVSNESGSREWVAIHNPVAMYEYIGFYRGETFEQGPEELFSRTNPQNLILFVDTSNRFNPPNRVVFLGKEGSGQVRFSSGGQAIKEYQPISSRGGGNLPIYFKELGDYLLSIHNKPNSFPQVSVAASAKIKSELLEVCKDYVLNAPFGRNLPQPLSKILQAIGADGLVSAAEDRQLFETFYAQPSGGDQPIFLHNLQNTPTNLAFQELDSQFSLLAQQRIGQLPGEEAGAYVAGVALLLLPVFKGVKIAQPLAKAGLAPAARTFKTVAWQPTANFAKSRWPAYKRIFQAAGVSGGIEIARGLEVDNNLQLSGVPTLTEIAGDFIKFPFYVNIMRGFKNLLASGDRALLAKMLYARTYAAYHLALHQCLTGAAEDTEALPPTLKFDQATYDEEVKSFNNMNRAVEQALNLFKEGVDDLGKGDCAISLPLGLGNAVCALANFVLGWSVTFTKFSFNLLLEATTLQ